MSADETDVDSVTPETKLHIRSVHYIIMYIILHFQNKFYVNLRACTVSAMIDYLFYLACRNIRVANVMSQFM